MKVGLIFGTRPEAIKMAPVFHTLKQKGIDAKVIATAQHREMLDQVLELFGITPDYDLNVMTHRQTLATLTKKLIEGLDEVLTNEKFDYLLVHGDTTSTFVGSLAAFYHKIPVGHVEAGLRTDSMYDPYPEEMNRRLATRLCTSHFAPTDAAKENLLKEAVEEKGIVITGNTVIDALLWVTKNKKDDLDKIKEKYGLTGKKYILMTMHRRENWGERMRNTMHAVKKYLMQNPDTYLVYPVHMNPAVRDIVYPELGGLKNAILIEPVEYLEFVSLMDGCWFIMTDSGGIQEEAPSLGKPTLVLRKTTERPEAIAAGTAKLIGTDIEVVYEYMKKMEGPMYEEMKMVKNPFGDGNASQKIADYLKNEALFKL